MGSWRSNAVLQCVWWNLLSHPVGTSEISDWNQDITNFWPIEVNGRNFSGIFPLKNPQISQRTQHPFWKLVYSMNILCVGICYQIIFKCNWERNQRKSQFCLNTHFLSISNFWLCAQTGLNQFKLFFCQSVISDPLILLLKIPWKSVISDKLQAVRITDWILVRIYWTYLSICHFEPISKLKSWNMAMSVESEHQYTIFIRIRFERSLVEAAPFKSEIPIDLHVKQKDGN